MLQPLLNRVLLKKVEEEKTTASGIIISDKTSEKPSTGKIIAIGEKGQAEEKNDIRKHIQVGDQVIYKQYAGTDVKHNQESYVIVDMADVLAVVKENK